MRLVIRENIFDYKFNEKAHFLNFLFMNQIKFIHRKALPTKRKHVR